MKKFLRIDEKKRLTSLEDVTVKSSKGTVWSRRVRFKEGRADPKSFGPLQSTIGLE